MVSLYLGNTIEEIRGGTYDQVSYDMLAQRVVAGHGFSFAQDWWPYTRAERPTSFWSYLYTLYLAGTYWVFGHHPFVPRLIQAAVTGLLMPWLVYRIGRRTFGERPALIAAFLVAAYAYFVLYSASLMTEALYIVAVLWVVDVLMRMSESASDANAVAVVSSSAWWRYGLELGFAIAVALMLRQVFIVMFLVSIVWLVWIAWRRAWLKPVLMTLAIGVGVCALLIAPWLLRNYLVFGKVTVMPNTNSGFAFFWANHPVYGTQFEPVLSPDHGLSYQELIPAELRGLDEVALDRALLSRGLQFVIDEPDRYLLLSLSRVPVFFTFWSLPQSSTLSNAARMLSFGLLLPLMVCGVILAVRDSWRRWRRPSSGARQNSDLGSSFILLFLGIITVYSGVHIASWANVRYRLPVDALLILFAAYAIDRLIGWLLSLRNEQVVSAQKKL
jgi:4-amino-4-deoxy-L-arabinose transferase-like glycosyltransferase